jgi:hypothetical protein
VTEPFIPRSALDLAERLEERYAGRINEATALKIGRTLWQGFYASDDNARFKWDDLLDIVYHATYTGPSPNPGVKADAQGITADDLELTIEPPPPEPTEVPGGYSGDAVANELADVLLEHIARNPNDMPVPGNMSLVGVRGRGLFIGLPLAGQVSKGQALNAAAWIVALADPTLESFGPMLAKVLST